MDEEKPPTLFKEVKEETEEYPHEMGEKKPPSLPPIAPPQRIRFAVANFAMPVNFRNDRKSHLYDRYANYSTVERYNEEVAMRFLFGNGKPLSSIDDEHFLTFLHYLNPTRPPPEARNMRTRTMTELKPDIKYQSKNGPLCVTIEAIRKKDEIFLSISAHFYNQNGQRQNSVHFEKVILADYEGKVVADRIRKVVDVNKCQNFGVSYILSPNIRMLTLVTETREAILVPQFDKSLKKLRAFVEAIHKHQEVYTKFRKIQIDTNSNVDIPVLDSDSDWLSTLQFLSTCSQLNETFSNIHETWCMPPYLDASEENAIANLYDLLMMFCQVASQLCSEDSCVSQIYYSMSILNHAIGNITIKTVRDQLRKTFNKYYQSIAHGKVGDFYSTAALLDPRYGFSGMVFTEDDWKNVEAKLLKKLEGIYPRRFTIQKEMNYYKRLIATTPTFDEVNTHLTWWYDRKDELPILYQQWIEYSTVPAVSVDGNILFGKGGKLAHLFATLDEEMHFKALRLAQSSQGFIGRGSSSIAIQMQVAEIENKFRQQEEVEETGEGEMIVDAPQGEEVEVKQEIPDDSDGMQEHGAAEQDIKDEEPDDFIS